MKRVIKFRAIEFGEKHFVYGSLIVGKSLKGLPFVQIENADAYEFRNWDGEVGTIGQYTGLLDKNGTEIYEGDIVRRNKINYAYDEIDNPKVAKWLEEISFIEYRHNGFWVNSESFGYEGENLWDWDSLEVIGNLYESPELLTNQTSAL